MGKTVFMFLVMLVLSTIVIFGQGQTDQTAASATTTTTTTTENILGSTTTATTTTEDNEVNEFDWIPPSGKTLVWSDEFDGTNIKRDNWDYDTGPWTANNEKEYYTDNGIGGPNAYISNGALVIKAMKQTRDQREYTSARLKTEGKKYWKYGTVVAKMKLPYGKGIWPAFWMLGNDMASVNYPKCGEIDIMELVGGGDGDNTTYATMHWEGPSHELTNAISGVNQATSPLSQGWHYYQMDWDPKNVVIKFDGKEYFRQNISGSDFADFHKPFFLILNIAVGGDWPKDPDETTTFPQYMYVDWVRVYQDAGVSGAEIDKPDESRKGKEVLFPDPNLDAAIREAINKPNGAIYTSDLEGLKRLDAPERGIRDIAGLEYCTNLEYLNLGGSRITDVSPLSGLIKLEILSLARNQITDVSPLSGLTELTQLGLSCNQITDVSSLSGLTKLVWLDLGANPITDVSPLSGLTNAKIALGISGVADLDPKLEYRGSC